VPVGLVDNAVGGSGTEAWLPREVLEARRDYQELLGDHWHDSENLSAWARGRAKRNLGSHVEASHPFKPGFLFESGLRDWAGFPFDGVFWYQGETNAEMNYAAWNERLITDLVLGWRKVLGEKDLPFFMIQLPRIGGNDPLRKFWPECRKAQATAAEKLTGVSLIVTEDLGYESPDVHPPEKRPVAMRLADAVMKVARL
jgi:sialate O-acetylesterase